MRRKRTRAVGQQVSLFPFLAVLICTMGVLIVLLVLVVKHADLAASQSREESVEELAKQAEELEFEVDSAKFRAEEMLAFRPEALAQVQQQQRLRGHLEDHQRKLIAELKQLQTRWQALNQEANGQSVDVASELQEAERQMAMLQAQIEQERLDATGRRARTAVVAYDGRSGTLRRPIYIECRPDGIHLQPFDIHLTEKDFTEPILPGNPLDAAILAIRERWVEEDPRQSQGAPYPLILVRPGGSLAYAVVRQAMKSWDSEFGHQIVPEQLELAYPAVDPLFGDELQEVIAAAKLRQERISSSVAGLADRLRGGGAGGTGGNQISTGAYGSNSSSSEGSFGSGSTESSRSVPESLRATGRRGGFVSNGESSFGNQPGGSGEDRNANRNGFGQGDVAAQQASSRSGTAGDPTSGAQGGQATGQGSDTGVSIPSNNSPTASSTSSLAESRGSNWALPTRTAGATAFRRPIKVSCYADRMILHGSQLERRRDVELKFEPSIESAMDPMVEAIWNRIDSWGVAGFNSYWRPELQVRVLPGGESAYRQLQVLLNDSGLGVAEDKP